MSASAAVSRQNGFVNLCASAYRAAAPVAMMAAVGALVGAAVSKIFLTLAWTGGALAGAAAMSVGAFVFLAGRAIVGKKPSDGAFAAMVVAAFVAAPICGMAACAAAGIRITQVQATLIFASSIAAFMSLLPAKGK